MKHTQAPYPCVRQPAHPTHPCIHISSPTTQARTRTQKQKEGRAWGLSPGGNISGGSCSSVPPPCSALLARGGGGCATGQRAEPSPGCLPTPLGRDFRDRGPGDSDQQRPYPPPGLPPSSVTVLGVCFSAIRDVPKIVPPSPPSISGTFSSFQIEAHGHFLFFPPGGFILLIIVGGELRGTLLHTYCVLEPGLGPLGGAAFCWKLPLTWGWGEAFQDPQGCPKPQRVPNPGSTGFFLSVHTYDKV